MIDGLDPSTHKQRERQIMGHIERLLSDDRLRIDTTRGRRPAVDFEQKLEKADHAIDLKRLMSEVGRPDRELQAAMPVGESIDVKLVQKRWWFFTRTVGQFKAVVVSPSRALLVGDKPEPLDITQVRKLITDNSSGNVPGTLVIASTSGFKIETHELAVRGANRTVILVEPNQVGGWSAHGPVETKALVDLFDPEEDEQKRTRLRETIKASQADFNAAGVAADKLAAKTQLPLTFVENELKSYAKENPGLATKRLDGRWVLFREATVTATPGGADMPLVDRIKTLFGAKSDNVKKIAFLAERRTALAQQRDRAYEDLNNLESSEGSLKDQFKQSSSDLAKRRITSQMLQLRKDIERRQQLMAVLNQQINVVSTHLHNLELVQQGTGARLPDSEEMATDAAAAEDMLADLQASSELADTVGTTSSAGLSAEEQALFEELEREAGGTATHANSPTNARVTGPVLDTGKSPSSVSVERASPKRSEPEAG